MVCPHCQTWILDEEHRCQRCGRRVRSTRRHPSDNYPVSTSATAHAYDFAPLHALQPEAREMAPIVHPGSNLGVTLGTQAGQQSLFANPNPSRVIAFDSLTSPLERESIRARAAQLERPAPMKQAKVEVPRARARKKTSQDQQRLDFFGVEEVLSPPQSHIICDAPVAPASLRAEAALIDGAIIVAGCLLGAAGFVYAGGGFSLDRHVLPWMLLALLTVPAFYKLLWTYFGRDTIGMSATGLRLVDFDGNPPSLGRRYQRLAGSFISLLAAGIGLVWALVDEDALTWHDHISSTFPTIASES